MKRASAQLLCRAEWVRRCLSAIVILSPLHSAAFAAQEERLYGLGGVYLSVHDTETGAMVQRTRISGANFSMTPLAMANGKLWSILNWLSSDDLLFEIHPASAEGGLVGSTTFNFFPNIGLAAHPVTGEVFVSNGPELFTLDLQSGLATFRAAILGLRFNDCLCSLAIDSTGTAYAPGSSGTPALYSLDLSTGLATDLGDLPLSPGFFTDVAFDSSGMLWGIYRDVGGGPWLLLKIDVNTKAVTVVTTNLPVLGLAFGPACIAASFCEPKPNSLGCDPTIDASGLASPTASSGFEITCSAVRNNTHGFLLYGSSGQTLTPFRGGYLCVAPPLRRTPLSSSQGTPPPTRDCTGNWSLDFNTFLSTKPPLAAGITLQCQWMGRDGGYPAPDNVSLSNAIEFTLCP